MITKTLFEQMDRLGGAKKSSIIASRTNNKIINESLDQKLLQNEILEESLGEDSLSISKNQNLKKSKILKENINNLKESDELNSDYIKDQVKRRNSLFNKLCKDLNLTKAIYLSSGRGLTNRNDGDIGAIYSKIHDILDILSDIPSVLDDVEKYLTNNYPEINFTRKFDDTIVIQGSELSKLNI